MSSVCSSSKLDEMLSSDTHLNISYRVPRSACVEFVSEKTTGMELPEFDSDARVKNMFQPYFKYRQYFFFLHS